MAVRIRNFSHQNWQVATPVRLNIRITGNPEDVKVSGLPLGMYYHWNTSRNRVEIRGTPEKVVFGKDMVVTADDQVRRQTYSVYPLLPVYNQDVRETVLRGIPFTLPVKIDNAPVNVKIDGPWNGVDYRVDTYGYHFYGLISEDANFTRDTFEYSVEVMNQQGTVPGTITITTTRLGDARFYVLDGHTVKVFPAIAPPEGDVVPTLTQIKSFDLPSIPGSVANYVAIANDGENLYVLHSKPQSEITNRPDDLDDQIVVVSPATANGGTAGILRRFPITRVSTYYDHDLEDLYHHDEVLYISTRYRTSTAYNSFSVLYRIGEHVNTTRIISLLESGGGIALTRGFLTAALYNQSVNQRNYFRVYPPSYVSGMPLIADSAQVYTTSGVIRADLHRNVNDLTMTGLGNFAYILSATLPDVMSVVEVPDPVGVPIRRGEINLSPVLTQPNGITHL